MFGFKKNPCVDMDLFGYLTQALGGTINRLSLTGGAQFNAEDILTLVDFMLNQHKKTIDSRQLSLLKFAAGAITERYYDISNKNSKIKTYCDRFAEMMKSDFDFNDTAFTGMHSELMLMGCCFMK